MWPAARAAPVHTPRQLTRIRTCPLGLNVITFDPPQRSLTYRRAVIHDPGMHGFSS